MRIIAYLNFNGDCAEAFRHYERVLGGTIETMQTFGETPMGDETPPEWHDRIVHALLRVGDQALMGYDAPPDSYQQPQGFSVSLQIDAAAEAERTFAALAEDGTVTMPFEKTYWAAGGFGTLVDRFGTPWLVNSEGTA